MRESLAFETNSLDCCVQPNSLNVKQTASTLPFRAPNSLRLQVHDARGSHTLVHGKKGRRGRDR